MKKLHGFLALTSLLCIATSVSAGWGSSGGSNFSSGGYGSAGGSYSGGYGSSGGISAGYGSGGGVAQVGPLRRLVSHIHARHTAGRAAYSAGYASSGGGGSSGGVYRRSSYGSSGGNYSGVGYGSSGGAGSSGHSYSQANYGSSGGGYSRASYGSTGGSYYSGSVQSHGSVGSSYESSQPIYNSPSTNAPIYDAPMVSPTSGTKPTYQWSNQVTSSNQQVISRDEIHLNVRIPEAAIVYVNGNRTNSSGALRHFVSKSLDTGASYRFEVRAEREINGRTIAENKTIVLAAGGSELVEFSLEDKAQIAETVLTLNVPSDAKVTLAGNGTKSLGESRTYRTKELATGQVWEDYKILVNWNGQVKERTIRLIGGDDLEISFNFDEASNVAMR